MIVTKRAESFTGGAFSKRVSTMLKTVELAPIPSAKESTATAAKPGFLASMRKPYLKS